MGARLLNELGMRIKSLGIMRCLQGLRVVAVSSHRVAVYKEARGGLNYGTNMEATGKRTRARPQHLFAFQQPSAPCQQAWALIYGTRTPACPSGLLPQPRAGHPEQLRAVVHQGGRPRAAHDAGRPGAAAARWGGICVPRYLEWAYRCVVSAQADGHVLRVMLPDLCCCSRVGSCVR